MFTYCGRGHVPFSAWTLFGGMLVGLAEWLGGLLLQGVM